MSAYHMALKTFQQPAQRGRLYVVGQLVHGGQSSRGGSALGTTLGLMEQGFANRGTAFVRCTAAGAPVFRIRVALVKWQAGCLQDGNAA